MESNRAARRNRGIVAGALAVFLVGILAVSMSWGASKPHSSNGLTTTTLSTVATPYPTKNLPPSRDNDAGRARSPDATPDNDTDAWQR